MLSGTMPLAGLSAIPWQKHALLGGLRVCKIMVTFGMTNYRISAARSEQGCRRPTERQQFGFIQGTSGLADCNIVINAPRPRKNRGMRAESGGGSIIIRLAR